MEDTERYLNSMRATFVNADPFRALYDLATDEVTAGASRETLLEWHEEARERFAEQEDFVLEMMDCLAGWCATEMRIVPRSKTDAVPPAGPPSLAPTPADAG